MLLIVGDGLTGLKETGKKAYLKAHFQTCVLHKVEASLNKVRRKDIEKVARELKQIYEGNNRKKTPLGLEKLGKKLAEEFFYFNRFFRLL